MRQRSVSSTINGGGGNASFMTMEILQSMLYFGNFHENPATPFFLTKWHEWLNNETKSFSK